MVKPPRQILKTINRDEISSIDVDGTIWGADPAITHGSHLGIYVVTSTHKPDHTMQVGTPVLLGDFIIAKLLGLARSQRSHPLHAIHQHVDDKLRLSSILANPALPFVKHERT